MNNIPEYYKIKFEKLVKEMEQETGNTYQLSINELNIDYQNNIIINDFKNRNFKIEIDGMVDNMNELKGKYTNFEEIRNKIKVFKTHEFYSDIKSHTNKLGHHVEFGNCKTCGTTNFNIHIPCINTKCDMSWKSMYKTSIWDNLEVCEYDFTLYKKSPFDQKTHIPFGKWKFVVE